MTRVLAMVVLAGALVPIEARACGNPEDGCEWGNPIPDFVELEATEIPENGALFIVVGDGFDSDAWSLEVKVYDAFGIETPGTFEIDYAFGNKTWRPTQPWRTGEQYLVVLRILTDPEGSAYPECEGIQVDTVIDIVEPLDSIAPPAVTIEEQWTLTASETLGALVCCDGALPYSEQQSDPSYGCGDPDTVIAWRDGSCVAGEAHGALEIWYRLDVANNGDESRWAMRVLTSTGTRGDPNRQLLVKDERDAAGCVRIEILDRALGIVYDQPACHGEDIADQLGELSLDIAGELAERCEGEPYVCEQAAGGWDQERCRPWPEQLDAPYLPGVTPPGEAPPPADEACTVGERPSGFWATLLAMSFFARRRARGRRPAPVPTRGP